MKFANINVIFLLKNTVRNRKTLVCVQNAQRKCEESVKIRLNKPIAKCVLLYYNLDYVLVGSTCVRERGAWLRKVVYTTFILLIAE